MNDDFTVTTPIQVTVKPMSQSGELDHQMETFTTSVVEFFTDLAPRFQYEVNFPMWARREGGCQFAFDKVPTAPLLCHECSQTRDICRSSGEHPPMMCEMEAAPTHIIMLDLDREVLPEEGTNKYDEPLRGHIAAIEQFETKLEGTSGVAFYYRTKCFGLRVGFAFRNSVPPEKLKEAVDLCVDRILPLPTMLKVCHHGSYFSLFQVYPRRGAKIWVANGLVPI